MGHRQPSVDLLNDHSRQLRWTTVIGNHQPKRMQDNLNHPAAIVGFSFAGAHLRNMAFYNFGLCLLQLSLQYLHISPQKAVWRSAVP